MVKLQSMHTSLAMELALVGNGGGHYGIDNYCMQCKGSAYIHCICFFPYGYHTQIYTQIYMYIFWVYLHGPCKGPCKYACTYLVVAIVNK